jgi:membrane protease YdiL (CAAX protease family)
MTLRSEVFDARAAIVAAGVIALLLRPVGWTAPAVTACVGAAALAVPLGRARERLPWAAVTLAGAACFVLVRLRSFGLPVRATAAGVAASVVAAVAEEAFFRRLVYARFEKVLGAGAAVVAAAALFAVVHVPAYGVAALPVDFAAGLVLGWQRWASGTWTSPAAAHVLANVVQLV